MEIPDPELTHHAGPLGRLFDAAATGAVLSAEQVERFHRDGFLAGHRVLDEGQLAAVRAVVDDLAARRHPGTSRLPVYRDDGEAAPQLHVVGAWRVDEVLHDLVFHPAIAGPVTQLVGGARPRLFRDQLFLKAAGSRGVVPWHQDYSDWAHTAPAGHVTCWIALDDTDAGNGCLHYLPGSHRHGLLAKIGPRDDMDSAFARLPADLREGFAPVAAPVRAGECVFHHCLTVHGSHGNASGGVRRAIALAYMHPDTRSLSGERPVIPGGPRIAPGEPIAGVLFPEVGGAA